MTGTDGFFLREFGENLLTLPGTTLSLLIMHWCVACILDNLPLYKHACRKTPGKDLKIRMYQKIKKQGSTEIRKELKIRKLAQTKLRD